MNNIGLVVEEVADLPAEIVQANRIELVPVKMIWPELENIPGNNTFQKMRELERRGLTSFGKTSQPSPEDYLIRFKTLLTEFDRLLCITVSSRVSGCYNSAFLAKKLLSETESERVCLVDSLSATCGHALVVMKAIAQIEAGHSLDDILKTLDEFIPQVRFFAMVSDPKWLEAHGRLSHTAAQVMRLLAGKGIRPLLKMERGALGLAGLKMRARDMAQVFLKQLQTTVATNSGFSGHYDVAITHADNTQISGRLKEMIETGLPDTKVVMVNVMNEIIGVPIGPDAVAVAICPA